MKSAVKAMTRCLTVAIAICAWLTISNHCAIRAVETKTVSTHHVCPFHSTPAKSHPEPAETECCKILRAVVSTPAKTLTPPIIDLPRIDCADITDFRAIGICALPVTLDTGPPGKTSFAELNRSMRVHAPPMLS